MKNLHLFSYLLGCCFFIQACTGNSAQQRHNSVNTDEIAGQLTDSIHADSVLYSFVFMGCNRIDWKDTLSKHTNASTANLSQLSRTFNEVCNLNPKPKFFFFLGDLVLGLSTQNKYLENQLKAWKAVYYDTTFSPIAQSGISMVAIPGNHEMLYMDKTANGKREVPFAQASSIWLKQMQAFMPPGKINYPPPSKGAVNGNQLTYSFDYENTHFVLVNTDTYVPEQPQQIGLAPANWIAADIQAAKKQPGTKHVFVLGHKPSYVDDVKEPDEIMDTSVTNVVWPAMQQYQAEAMLSAHSHQYYRTQPTPNQTYQVIAGNGGSKYTGGLPKNLQFYGYSIVYVMKNGKVLLRSMGRSVAKKDYLKTVPPSVPTTTRDFVDISWGTTAPTWVVK